MKFDVPLLAGRLLRRYKRFLADVELENGEVVVAHTANTGAMTGCAEPGSRVWLSESDNPKRKCRFTWELVETSSGALVGINTLRANKLVEEAVHGGQFAMLNGYESVRREVAYGEEGSRIDLFLESALRPACYIEVKNATLVNDGIARFPDAVSVRGQKHLRELISVVHKGDRAVLCFCVQRQDVSEVRPADHIDADYGRLLRLAYASGVDVMALQARVSIKEVVPENTLPVILSK